MRKSILVLIIVLFAGLQAISARPRISIGKTENIEVVHEFPNTEEYMTNPGRFFDLAILYETFNVGGLPLWVTKEPVLVGTENMNTDFYLDLDEATADEIVASHNLDKEKLLKLSIMDKYSGWLVLLAAIIIGIIYSLFFTSKNEDEYHDNGDEIETIKREDKTIVKEKN